MKFVNTSPVHENTMAQRADHNEYAEPYYATTQVSPTPVTYIPNTSEKHNRTTNPTKSTGKTGLFTSAPSSSRFNSPHGKVASYTDEYTKDSYYDDSKYYDYNESAPQGSSTSVFPAERPYESKKAIEAGVVAAPRRAHRGRVEDVRGSMLEEAPPRYSMGRL
ncbi:hypothetical protein BC829DRAFT_401503 [Chytridium lagenaria]|nr:hypothetical protein BC829DRAFT_401503 [Chytridium lagenaria]